MKREMSKTTVVCLLLGIAIFTGSAFAAEQLPVSVGGLTGINIDSLCNINVGGPPGISITSSGGVNVGGPEGIILNPPHPVMLGAGDNGRTIELNKCQTLVITLEANPSTGFTWEAVEFDEHVLRQVGEIEFQPESSAIGAGGVQILRFEAVNAGQTPLKLVDCLISNFRYSTNNSIHPSPKIMSCPRP